MSAAGKRQDVVAIEPRLSPADIVYLQTPPHRRPVNPSAVPKSAVNRVREKMRRGEIDATCERLKDGRERWWTTEQRYRASVEVGPQVRPSEPASEIPTNTVRLLSPAEMQERHQAAKRAAKKEAPNEWRLAQGQQ